jgi:hypothetical protein
MQQSVKENVISEIASIGPDLAKRVLWVHGAEEENRIILLNGSRRNQADSYLALRR